MHLRDFSFPNFTFSKKHEKDDNRYILLTPFHANNTFPSYAWLLSTTGDLLWYKRGKNDKIISDFKQTTLPNGKKIYSYMQQEKPIPPSHYLQGSLIIMNNKFETINQLTIKETKKHPALLVENHASLILDKNHFVLSSYHETEILHPETEEPVFVTQTVIQEIKDGKVVFDWVSSDHPELYTHFKYPNDYLDKNFHDYMHFNSIIIDPKDNNFIVSFASQSSVVKLNRQTGEIMWTLGGLGDDFKLDKKYHFFGQHSLSFDDKGNLMLFDNQSANFKNRISKEPELKYSRILKFKLDEKNKQIVNIQEIPLDFHTQLMGSVYETEKDTFIVSKGTKNGVQKIKLDNSQKQKEWELLINLPTYRAYEVKSLK